MADDDLSPLEFAMLKSLERHIRTSDQPTQRSTGRPVSLKQRSDEAALVLSVIAHSGAPDDGEKSAAAFARGKQSLKMPNLQLVPPDKAKPAQLDNTIEKLACLSPNAKKNLINGCAEVAASDGHLDPNEIDLIRALGELWDCPFPLPAGA